MMLYNLSTISMVAAAGKAAAIPAATEIGILAVAAAAAAADVVVVAGEVIVAGAYSRRLSAQGIVNQGMTR